MRLLVRSGVHPNSKAQIFMGNDTRSGHTEDLYAIQEISSCFSNQLFSTAKYPLRRKDNASQGASLHLQAMLVSPQ